MKFFSNTAKGFKVKRRLKHWTPICEAWAFNLERYCRLADVGDIPYYTNERANVGFLAGAAWSAGAIAMEEFPCDKGTTGNEVSGRVDLWICSENGKEEYIEAKFKSVSVHGNYINQINKVMEKAIAAAQHTKGDSDSRTVAISFIAFEINEPSSDKVLEYSENALIDISKQVDFDLLAWCFPESCVEYVADDWVFPGIVMIGKVI